MDESDDETGGEDASEKDIPKKDEPEAPLSTSDGDAKPEDDSETAKPDVDPKDEPQEEVPVDEEMTEEKYLKESIDAVRAYVKANKELFYDRY